jgi:ribose 5-phosphate isomerase RpiB
VRIAVISETSTADKNHHILSALEGRGHEVVNAGMSEKGAVPELNYIHAGVLAGLLLNLGRADYVVGGCSTGQGFMNVALQFPNVVCGQIRSPLDAWLFSHINGGNCVSLTLNQEYGWAGEVNLRFIFDRLFEAERGAGYPASRREFQKKGRESVARLSVAVHPALPAIVAGIPEELMRPVLSFPGVPEILDIPSVADVKTRVVLEQRLS